MGRRFGFSHMVAARRRAGGDVAFPRVLSRRTGVRTLSHPGNNLLHGCCDAGKGRLICFVDGAAWLKRVSAPVREEHDALSVLRQ